MCNQTSAVDSGILACFRRISKGMGRESESERKRERSARACVCPSLLGVSAISE